MSTSNDDSFCSVLMTVYNGMPFLKEAVASILNKTYENLELIVVDDGSTDDSVAYLNSIQDDRLVLIEASRLGRGKALNLGLEYCKGDFVAINDADDISYIDRIEKQVQFLNDNPNYGLVGSLSSIKNFESGEVRKHSRPTAFDNIKKGFTKGQPIQHVTVMFRRSCLIEVGGYTESIKFLFDRDIFLKIAARQYKMANLNEELVQVGHHGERFFYHSFKGIERELLSLKYRINAIRIFEYPKSWILREVVASVWSLTPRKVRKVIINTYKLKWKK